MGGALSVGLGAGCISTLGFQYLTPFLDRTIGLGDTCGERFSMCRCAPRQPRARHVSGRAC